MNKSRQRDKKRKGSKEPAHDVELLREIYDDPLEYVLKALHKKIRNVEKRETRLIQIQQKLDRGEALEADQKLALSKKDQVAAQIEIAKEFIATLETTKTQKAVAVELFKKDEEATAAARLQAQVDARVEELKGSWMEELVEEQTRIQQEAEEAAAQAAAASHNAERDEAQDMAGDDHGHDHDHDHENQHETLAPLNVVDDAAPVHAANAPWPEDDLTLNHAQDTSSAHQTNQQAANQLWTNAQPTQTDPQPTLEAALPDMSDMIKMADIETFTKLQLVLSILSRHPDCKNILAHSGLSKDEENTVAEMSVMFDVNFLRDHELASVYKRVVSNTEAFLKKTSARASELKSGTTYSELYALADKISSHGPLTDALDKAIYDTYTRTMEALGAQGNAASGAGVPEGASHEEQVVKPKQPEPVNSQAEVPVVNRNSLPEELESPQVQSQSQQQQQPPRQMQLHEMPVAGINKETGRPQRVPEGHQQQMHRDPMSAYGNNVPKKPVHQVAAPQQTQPSVQQAVNPQSSRGSYGNQVPAEAVSSLSPTGSDPSYGRGPVHAAAPAQPQQPPSHYSQNPVQSSSLNHHQTHNPDGYGQHPNPNLSNTSSQPSNNYAMPAAMATSPEQSQNQPVQLGVGGGPSPNLNRGMNNIGSLSNGYAEEPVQHRRELNGHAPVSHHHGSSQPAHSQQAHSQPHAHSSSHSSAHRDPHTGVPSHYGHPSQAHAGAVSGHGHPGHSSHGHLPQRLPNGLGNLLDQASSAHKDLGYQVDSSSNNPDIRLGGQGLEMEAGREFGVEMRDSPHAQLASPNGVAAPLGSPHHTPDQKPVPNNTPQQNIIAPTEEDQRLGQPEPEVEVPVEEPIVEEEPVVVQKAQPVPAPQPARNPWGGSFNHQQNFGKMQQQQKAQAAAEANVNVEVPEAVENNDLEVEQPSAENNDAPTTNYPSKDSNPSQHSYSNRRPNGRYNNSRRENRDSMERSYNNDRRDNRGPRENRDYNRDNRDNRENRENRGDTRENRGDTRDTRDHRDNREPRPYDDRRNQNGRPYNDRRSTYSGSNSYNGRRNNSGNRDYRDRDFNNNRGGPRNNRYENEGDRVDRRGGHPSDDRSDERPNQYQSQKYQQVSQGQSQNADLGGAGDDRRREPTANGRGAYRGKNPNSNYHQNGLPPRAMNGQMAGMQRGNMAGGQGFGQHQQFS